jgi:hypothetical protein
MADDQLYVAAIATIGIVLLAWQVLRKRFDPFAPVWMFLTGYLGVYVGQAISLREWALTIRGVEVVTAANQRALWALVWFLVVYYFGPGRALAARFPSPPVAWSVAAVGALTPLLGGLGLLSSWMLTNQVAGDVADSPEATLLYSFPFMTIVAGILLVVTGRQERSPNVLLLATGLGISGAYALCWMYLGKRSPALIGVLSTVCAYYVARRKRPSWPVLIATAFVGSAFVALAIGWRNNAEYDRSISGFVQYVGDFRLSSILKSLHVDNDEENLDPTKFHSFESEEYGGFLLMMDTVPAKADYDLGANYIRIVSTFIPRLLWPEKPLYGRDKWVEAWIAGSELKRDEDFTGPAIGLLGATQLNGGALATLIVLAVVAVLLRSGYEYLRLHDSVPWVQAWWSLLYYNAWYVVVADDPANWFYYNWGFTCLPSLAILWVVNSLIPGRGHGSAIPARA